MKKVLMSLFLILFISGCGCSSSSNNTAIYKQQLFDEYNYEYNENDFFSAVVTNDYEAVELFLKAGIDPDTKTSTGSPMMHSAIGFDAIETIDLLFEYGADPEFVNDLGVNYIYFAAINAQTCETITTLVDNDVDLYHKTNSGYNALDSAYGQLQYTVKYQVQVDCLEDLGLTRTK